MNLKRFLLAFCFILMTFYMVAGNAFAADAGACYSINDADARSYCLAKAHKEPGRCYNIQNPGMRSMCLAEVR